ncbi:hypothetical protein ALC152_17690 [Arcobacter sp. 15-2]
MLDSFLFVTLSVLGKNVKKWACTNIEAPINREVILFIMNDLSLYIVVFLRNFIKTILITLFLIYFWD